MSEPRLHWVAVADLPPQPWKNGGGTTREIAWGHADAVPAQGPAPVHAFDWRVSVADIDASGPFSAYPGIDRVITLLSGKGVVLRALGNTAAEAPGAPRKAQALTQAHRLDQPGEPFAFSGDMAVHADCLGGACRDFNVMTRRAALRAEVSVLSTATALPPMAHALLFAWGGDWRVSVKTGAGCTAECTLSDHHAVWWQHVPDLTLETAVQPCGVTSRLLCVQWRPAPQEMHP